VEDEKGECVPIKKAGFGYDHEMRIEAAIRFDGHPAGLNARTFNMGTPNMGTPNMGTM
jgi:hypothetical protein